MKTSMLNSGLSQIAPEMAIMSQEIQNMRAGADKMAKLMDEQIKQMIKQGCHSEEAENGLNQKIHKIEQHVTSIEENLRKSELESASLHTENRKLKSENERLANENATYKRELRQKREDIQAARKKMNESMDALLGPHELVGVQANQ